jgi:hypothetical protein
MVVEDKPGYLGGQQGEGIVLVHGYVGELNRR